LPRSSFIRLFEGFGETATQARRLYGTQDGFVTLTQMNGTNRRNPRSSSHNFEPFIECLGAGLMESLAGDQMALQIEIVVDGIVNRQKSLH